MQINLMPIMLKRLIYTGSTLRSRSEEFKATVAADLRARIWPSFAEGQLATQTHRVFGFEKAADAHLMMQQAQHRGKLLLSPSL